MRVLVVEDEAKVSALIKAGLQEHGFVVETCGDGNEAMLRAESERFDALILDIMLPGRDGLSILRRLRASGNTVPVVLLTARGDVPERIEGLNLGADDYLSKPFSALELIARLNAVLRRHHGTGLTVQTCGDLSVNLVNQEVRRGTMRVELTAREYALLICLLRNPGSPVTRVELIQAVWGYQFDPGTNLVDVAIQRLRRKVDDPFPRKLIQTIRGVGYAIQAEP